MKNIKNLFKPSLLLCLLALGLSSCVKKEYDEPVTANVDPAGLVATHTIAQLQDSAGFIPRLITTDIVISGVIIADDESGSFYKELIIQDSTAGISIQVDVSNLNTNYPMGRRVFVKCKGLYIGVDDGNYSIGMRDGNEIARIPQSLYEQYIVKGMWGLTVTPTVHSLANVNNIPTNTLIQLNDVEFDLPDAGVTYANATTLTYKNLTVKDCNGDEVILYTSGYAKFASDTTPTGKGSLIAVFKMYSGDGELILRNSTEVNMTGTRCNGSTGNSTLMPIDSLRMVFTGTTTTAPIDRKIKGIVTSDISTSHITARNVVIQDNTGGILVRFTSNNVFSLGDEIEVNVSGFELSEFNGLLQVNNVPNTSATLVGTGTVTPATVTIAQILADFENFESTLVKIDNATISGTGTTYSGSKTLTDATGSITLFTSSAATFSGTTFPVTPVSLTGIVSQYTGTTPPGYQIGIRNLSDVQ